jgi:hypothetical protein
VAGDSAELLVATSEPRLLRFLDNQWSTIAGPSDLGPANKMYLGPYAVIAIASTAPSEGIAIFPNLDLSPVPIFRFRPTGFDSLLLPDHVDTEGPGYVAFVSKIGPVVASTYRSIGIGQLYRIDGDAFHDLQRPGTHRVADGAFGYFTEDGGTIRRIDGDVVCDIYDAAGGPITMVEVSGGLVAGWTNSDPTGGPGMASWIAYFEKTYEPPACSAP